MWHHVVEKLNVIYSVAIFLDGVYGKVSVTVFFFKADGALESFS